MGTMDGAMRGAFQALADVHRIGNQRAGVVTDCKHCFMALRQRARMETQIRTYRCSECGARWRGTGAKLVRV